MEVRNVFVLFGPPGAGKGRVRPRLAEAVNAAAFSTGEHLNYLRNAGKMTRLQEELFDSGELFPDLMMAEVVKKFIHEHDSNLVFDGYPRTIEQCVDFFRIMIETGCHLRKFLIFQAPEEMLIERILNRRICENCQHPALPSENSCRECGAAGLIKKGTIDDEATAKRRIAQYAQLLPPIEVYNRKLITIIDASKLPEEVEEQVVEAAGHA